MAKKAKAAPRTSPKYAAAELRKQLFDQLAGPEQRLRTLLTGINKLRHGDLDLVSSLPEYAKEAEALADAIDDVAKDLGEG